MSRWRGRTQAVAGRRPRRRPRPARSGGRPRLPATSAAPSSRSCSTEADAIAARSGVRLELVGVAVGDAVPSPRPGCPPSCSPATPRVSSPTPASTWWWSSSAASTRPGSWSRRPWRPGKPVVTANKELIAAHGAALADAAAAAGVDLLYEAAVAGRHPPHPPPARVPGRRAHPAGGGHRQRDDQLHPDARCPRRVCPTPRRWPRPSAWASPSATRRPTSRVTTPPPRRPSWPAWPSGATSWPDRRAPRGDRRPSTPSTSPSPTGSGTW